MPRHIRTWILRLEVVRGIYIYYMGNEDVGLALWARNSDSHMER